MPYTLATELSWLKSIGVLCFVPFSSPLGFRGSLTQPAARNRPRNGWFFWYLTRFAISEKLTHLRCKFAVGEALCLNIPNRVKNQKRNRTSCTFGKMEHRVTNFEKLPEENQTTPVYGALNSLFGI